ncbi:MAG: flavin reductase [Bacillota bacterium]|nr:flavin reductase [Bacillota bacterium]
MDKTVLFQLSYGLYAIGVMDYNNPTGCIVNTVFQVTSDEPSIAISINKDNYTMDILKQNPQFAVSILGENADTEVIGSLGFTTGKEKKDKFSTLPYQMMDGAPVVSHGATGYLRCEVLSMTENGTHIVVIAKVLDAKHGEEGNPMTYKYYHEVKKGSAPKNAPTYRGEDTEDFATASTGPRYRCMFCGYIHEGELPDDFVCPGCGMPASAFEKISE